MVFTKWEIIIIFEFFLLKLCLFSEKNSFHCAQSLLMPKGMLCWSQHLTMLSFLKAVLLVQHLFLGKTQNPKADLLGSSCMRKAICPHLEHLGLSMETYMSSMLCVSIQS